MLSKNDQVRQLVAKGEYKKALQICKDWDYNHPDHRDKLRLGYECLMYPKFYRQLGKDTEYHYNEAIAILIKVYG